jgi:hypothetical protein
MDVARGPSFYLTRRESWAAWDGWEEYRRPVELPSDSPEGLVCYYRAHNVDPDGDGEFSRGFYVRPL